MSDAYDFVAKGKLKLKTDGSIKKKKKKKSKDKDKEKEAYQKALEEDRIASQQQSSSSGERKLTKAEQAFKIQQEKMVKLEIFS